MKHRSIEPELMDDFGMQGTQMTEALDKIAWINKALGGNRVTVKAVMDIARKAKDRKIRITDLGCGSGDMLRTLADAGLKKDLRFHLTGIDANPFTVKYAKERSAHFSNITYHCADILAPDFVLPESDMVLLTLTLHHFNEQQILELLRKIVPGTGMAIIVNDLQRSRLAYWLFTCMSRILQFGTMNDNDGRVSIQRGFKRKELKQLSRKMNFKHDTIRWKWAFRYCWIITEL